MGQRWRTVGAPVRSEAHAFKNGGFAVVYGGPLRQAAGAGPLVGFAALAYKRAAMSYWLRAWGPPGRPTPQPSHSEIVPELVIGEYLLPGDVPWLAETLRVRAVLSLQDDGDLVAKNLSLAELVRAFAEQRIEFHRIPVADGSSAELLRALTPAVQWISERAASGQRVYLHCNAGINRAPTVAIAYLQASRRLTLEAARTWVQERRSCVPYVAVLRRWCDAGCP